MFSQKIRPVQDFLDALGTALMAADGDDVAEMLWSKLGWEPHVREKHDYSPWDEVEFLNVQPCLTPLKIGMKVWLVWLVCVCLFFNVCLTMFNPAKNGGV